MIYRPAVLLRVRLNVPFKPFRRREVPVFGRTLRRIREKKRRRHESSLLLRPSLLVAGHRCRLDLKLGRQRPDDRSFISASAVPYVVHLVFEFPLPPPSLDAISFDTNSIINRMRCYIVPAAAATSSTPLHPRPLIDASSAHKERRTPFASTARNYPEGNKG